MGDDTYDQKLEEQHETYVGLSHQVNDPLRDNILNRFFASIHSSETTNISFINSTRKLVIPDSSKRD